MKTIRKGNDIVVRWRIFRYGQKYDIALYRESISLVLSNMGEKKEITDYSIVDVNTIVFKYRAEDQGLGIYRLLLIDKSRNSTRIIEECNAFRLVNTSDAANNDDTLESAITITLTSELTAPADGLSAYEVALQNGFVGTEEEWLQSLVPDTTDIELAEAQRQAKELERIEAENTRQSAELERQNASAEAVSSANEAASNANEAAITAQQKSEEANTAASAANAAASNANTAAEKFNSAIVQETGNSQDKVMSQKAVTDALEGKQDTISDLETIREGAGKGSTALQKESDPVYLADRPSLLLEINGKANLQHQHTVADITDFPELYYDATAFLTSGTYPSDRYEELLEAVKAKKTVYATIDEAGYVSYIFFVSSANSDGSSSRVLLTTIFADGGNLYINTFVLQQSGMTRLQENITGKANKAGYFFAGVATPKTNPGTPDAKVFYIANGKGTYEKFGSIEVTEDDVVVLYWDSAWHKVATGIASQAKLSELETELANQDSRIKDVEKSLLFDNSNFEEINVCKDGFNSWDYGYIRPNGTIAIETSGSYKYSPKIPIKRDSTITLKQIYGNTAIASVASYTKDDTFVAECSYIGKYILTKDEPVVINTEGKSVEYIRITYGGGFANYDVFAFVGETIILNLHEKIELVETDYNDKIKKTNERIDSSGNVNPWKGKTWLALGTSITDTNNTLAPDGTCTGKYAPYLKELGEFGTFENKGVAGTIVGSHMLYYASHATHLADADLVTIEGFVNDWAGSKKLGKVGDTIPYHVSWSSPVWDNGGNDETGSFAGAVYQVLTTLMANAPKAKIVLITDNTGQRIPSTGADCARETLKNGLTQKDYTDMAIAVARYLGVEVINAGQESQINQNHPEYLIDQIHQTELGGQQFAKTIWSKLKGIYPIV